MNLDLSDKLNELIERVKKYASEEDINLIKKAFEFAQKHHDGQSRNSGEPYILHPLEVALILADLELDIPSIVAGLLHDVVEDTSASLEDVEREFGKEIAELVDGVTKLGKLEFTSKLERQVENYRKMLIAMAKDIRVILIKLADRLHNMRTLKYLPPEKQRQKAQETIDIYAPLAHRLGISKIKWELEDLSLRYLDPEGYYDLVEKIAKKRVEREEYIKRIISLISEKLKEANIEVGQIDGRPKHFYSIYRKMKEQGKTLEEIYDLFAIRIIVNSVKDCYGVLGIIHTLFKPMPGRFKDYIAMPKPNMYQSLHTTVIGPEGEPFEVQIRTFDMHRTAEYGIAAHWKYKEGRIKSTDEDEKFAWLRELLEWQKELKDAKEFMESLKINLFSDEVFVFTPKGDVISLPQGSTPIDFAYAIHSEIGNKMAGAKVNGKLVPIDYELKNGDIVEIITSPNVHGPSQDWLKIVKSPQAKSKINAWFKKERKEENIQKGKDILEKELKKLNLPLQFALKEDVLQTVSQRYGYRTPEDMFAALGYGGITATKIALRIKEEIKKYIKEDEQKEFQIEKPKPAKTSSNNGILVKGVENVLVRFAKCCNPVPGDKVIGYITRGRGVSIHRRDCPNVEQYLKEPERIVEAEWNVTKDAKFDATINVLANDRTGILMDITNLLGENKISVKAIQGRTTRDRIANINLTVEISSTEQLEKIIRKLRKIDSVFEVQRVKGG
ncbi:(p)ppGpp synthetase I, SpoT/RelA [Caldicellulosiruptor kronotskyensis 2002]|uniref:GTP diphosphokinase n=1 Tax=Caldicellulosiruptor kronotskyensis (strain DSM 18902 / VKM B-2412 / 2002) TaxID=632348 RepID=E4SEZ5_CALK2|nr:bifunctional (p)ppGpp synthetase/guanosine-3',5'-bis(diphosphate) 3'-pyrophosphohydrolase [Caldicellulosiruptor kronotskyensis]ADQ45632.1 (p)ppGpp synthetase I, SpoT/RelA [Caldicellulosiruptor kronotskyensis 2002]